VCAENIRESLYRYTILYIAKGEKCATKLYVIKIKISCAIISAIIRNVFLEERE
jgi:hypothetical protein